MTGTVLVLNAGYEPLHLVTVRHAIRMLVRGVAVVEESAPERTFGPFPYPRVLRLVRFVAARWLYRAAPVCTRKAVRMRDRACAYCGGPAETVDHLLPVSRGGELTWLNTVAACKRCNHRKANRTPEEAGMALRIQPYVPTPGYHLRLVVA